MCPGRGNGSEDELFDFQFAQLFQTRHKGREVRRLFVGREGLCIAPGFADHQHVAARGAFEQVVSHASFVFERGGCQLLGRAHQFFAVAFRRADKYIETYHCFPVFWFCRFANITNFSVTVRRRRKQIVDFPGNPAGSPASAASGRSPRGNRPAAAGCELPEFFVSCAFNRINYGTERQEIRSAGRCRQHLAPQDKGYSG